MNPTRLALVLMLVAPAAVAAPTEWMPAEADCTVAEEALEQAVADALEACADAREDGKTRHEARAACMVSNGFLAVEPGKAQQYGRFCRLTDRLLASDDDDPRTVEALPSALASNTQPNTP